MSKFVPGGPTRYAHQRRGLRKMIETKGVCALLFDPGTGKTATTLDFASVLSLKMPEDETGVRETRVLIAAPLAAVDTWVTQARQYLAPEVGFWAEALGGTIEEKAQALASRGGKPMKLKKRPRSASRTGPRALHTMKSIAWDARHSSTSEATFPLVQEQGPDSLDPEHPRLILTVVNLDAFSQRHAYGSKTAADLMLDAVKRYSPDLMVIDESHKIKGASSNVSRLMSRIADHVPRRVILTGTVMPKGPMDVYGQWRFLEPRAFGQPRPDGSKDKATFTHFKDRYAQMGGYMGREVVGFKNLDEMQDIMAENAIVARKKDALDLPKTTDATLTVHLDPTEADAYRNLKKNLAVQLSDGTTVALTNRLAQMMRLRQVTSGFLPDDQGVKHTVGTSKADAISSLVHDTLAGEDRVVIFALFTREIELLSEKLKRKGTTVEVIAGATPSEERIAIRRRFGSDSSERIVLVAQIKTLSLAVNELVTASHAIFASMSQQRDDYVQARDRLDRIGQTKPVTFWHAQVPGTVDGVILESHRDRTDLESAVLKHILDENDSP